MNAGLPPATAARLTALGIAVVMVLGAACTDAPTGPTPVEGAPSPPAGPAAPSLSAPAVTGYLLAGRFSYWIHIAIAAGPEPMAVTRIDFRYPESAQNTTFGLSHLTMDHAVVPGTSFTIDQELNSTVPVSRLDIVVSYRDHTGQARQLSASSTVPPILPDPPTPSLAIDAFTVTGFMEGTHYAYWPKLTLTASPGGGSLTVTRLLFGRSPASGSSPSAPRNIPIAAGTTLQLFHGLSYGEPEFYLTGPERLEELSATVLYIDDHGRTGSVSATAAVTR